MWQHRAFPLRLGLRGLCVLLLAQLRVWATLIEDVVDLPDVFIGGHRSNVFNSKGKYVVLLLHGYMNNVTEYYPLGKRFAQRGYAVVIPHDCSGPTAVTCAASWGKQAAWAVYSWAGDRPMAVVGHSMGGGAAMSAAKFVPGLAAYIAMHPAPILSGVTWAKVSGPILFTTGTLDTGTVGGGTYGATAPNRARESYDQAEEPKALVNVEGDEHWASLHSDGMEWAVVTMWLECYLELQAGACSWLRDSMCHNRGLAWCAHQGVSKSMSEHGMKDMHV